MTRINTLTVEPENLPGVLQEWLTANGLETSTTWELFFLPHEVVLRPKSESAQELEEWWGSFKNKYDETMQKLANS
jgi:hypothetical protein